MSTVMYKALKSAGVEEPLATVAAKQIPEEPATRGDVALVQSDIDKLIAANKADLAALEVRLTWRMITIGGVYTSLVVGFLKFL